MSDHLQLIFHIKIRSILFQEPVNLACLIKEWVQKKIDFYKNTLKSYGQKS